MKHGLVEFLPGTLLYREADKALAIVISAQVKLYPGPWHQLHVLLLTNNGQLVQDDREIDHIWHRGPHAWKVGLALADRNNPNHRGPRAWKVVH